MNAFLIFCKRERGSVRRRYPLLETREVTRVLGEWWASLGTPDKAAYSALAKQQKENLSREVEGSWPKGKMLTGKTRKLAPSTQPAIIPGKLADESQLGGLSSLILSKEGVLPEESKPPLPVPLKKRYREGIYPPTQPEPVVEEVLKEKTEQVVGPLDDPEDERRLQMWRSHILEENNNVKDRRARACKGQRYREFMWTNYTTRRKTNRWELNQDKNERSTLPAKQQKTAKNDSKSTKLLRSSWEEKGDSSRESCVGSSPEGGAKRSGKRKGGSRARARVERKSSSGCEENGEVSDNPSVSSEGATSFPLVTKSINLTNNNKPTLKTDKLDGVVKGSRKRKVRRQGIRRLTPGSTLNAVRGTAQLPTASSPTCPGSPSCRRDIDEKKFPPRHGTAWEWVFPAFRDRLGTIQQSGNLSQISLSKTSETTYTQVSPLLTTCITHNFIN